LFLRLPRHLALESSAVNRYLIADRQPVRAEWDSACRAEPERLARSAAAPGPSIPRALLPEDFPERVVLRLLERDLALVRVPALERDLASVVHDRAPAVRRHLQRRDVLSVLPRAAVAVASNSIPRPKKAR